MGTWGMRIYEDDSALDVRGDFLEARRAGKSVSEIEAQLRSEYIEGDNPENDDVVTLALCCVELETGTLTEATKRAALEVIESGRRYEHWLDEAGKEDAALRKHELTLVRKYIDKYDGKPVKRKSWVELQRADKEIAVQKAKLSRRWLWWPVVIAVYAVIYLWIK